MLIGLTGSIGHGKTTLADLLHKHVPKFVHFESSDVVMEVANALRSAHTSSPASDDYTAINTWLAPLPGILSAITHSKVTLEQLQVTADKVATSPQEYAKLFDYLDYVKGDLKRQRTAINATNKTDFRHLLQWLGGYLVAHVSSGIWFDEIVRRLPAPSSETLVTVGGLRYPADAEHIRTAGGTIVEINRPQLNDKYASDITERERSAIKYDCQIINNGTLDELDACAQRLLHDIRNQPNNLAPIYITKS